jgi:hypothetical protein
MVAEISLGAQRSARFAFKRDVEISRQFGRLRVAPGSLRLPDLLRVPRLPRRLEDACLDLDDRGRGRQ